MRCGAIAFKSALGAPIGAQDTNQMPEFRRLYTKNLAMRIHIQ
jgi:hypothetical protein